MYLFNFMWNIISKTWYILSVRRKETKWARVRLRELEQQLGGRLDDVTFHKVITSYGIYNPMMCDAFTRLRGRVSNRAERDRMLHYFICSSLFDNFCDRKELDQESLYEISFSPTVYQPKSFDESLFLYAHLLLKNYVRDKQWYETVTHRLYEAQEDSAKQFNPSITDEEIEQITLHKGGYSVLLCHFYLDDPAGKEEQQCWYLIGGIIQLTNDLYDIYKDYQEGIVTLPNRMQDAYAFHDYFTGKITQLKKEIAALPFPNKTKQHLNISLMGICSFGLIAIKQLQKIQKQADALPNLKQLPRKQLIVDMEKPANLYYCMRQVYLHAKKLHQEKQFE